MKTPVYRFDSNKQEFDAGRAELLGEGGEGKVYRLSYNLLGYDSPAVKIYARPTADRARKLRVMRENPPVDPTAKKGHISIAWPIDLVRDSSGLIVGYAMPRVASRWNLFDFYNPATRQEKNLTTSGVDYRFLHGIGRNLAGALNAIHDRGYVVGDLKAENVRVNDKGFVTLIDTDSFQITDPSNGRNYRCPVGTGGYMPPELIGKALSEEDRRPEQDLFGLAVLEFQLLMEGVHPFMGVGRPDAEQLNDRIKAGLFPYGGQSSVVLPPAWAPPFSILHPEVALLFRQCFQDGLLVAGRRPTAATWRNVLDEAISSLIRCGRNPGHIYGRHLRACPWCDRQAKLTSAARGPTRIASAQVALPTLRLTQTRLQQPATTAPPPSLPPTAAAAPPSSATPSPMITPDPPQFAAVSHPAADRWRRSVLWVVLLVLLGILSSFVYVAFHREWFSPEQVGTAPAPALSASARTALESDDVADLKSLLRGNFRQLLSAFGPAPDMKRIENDPGGNAVYTRPSDQLILLGTPRAIHYLYRDDHFFGIAIYIPDGPTTRLIAALTQSLGPPAVTEISRTIWKHRDSPDADTTLVVLYPGSRSEADLLLAISPEALKHSATGSSSRPVADARPLLPTWTPTAVPEFDSRLAPSDTTSSPTADTARGLPTSAVPFERDHLWGYMTPTGQVLIAPKYQEVGEYSDGLAPVKENGKWGFIDTSDRMRIAAQFDSALRFSDGLAAVEQHGSWGFVGADGSVAIGMQFSGVTAFHYGRAAACRAGKWGLIDRSGRFVLEPIYDAIRSFSEGFAACRRSKLWGLLRQSGQVAVPLQFDGLGDVHEGVLWMRTGSKVGYLGQDGGTIIAPQFSDAGDFSGGLAPAAAAGAWGFINRTGVFVIVPRFRSASAFSEGLAIVREDGKVGFLLPTGSFAVAPRFDMATPFRNGLSRVLVSGKWSTVDTSGKTVTATP